MKKMKQFLIAFVLILTMCTPAVYADEASDYYSSMMSSTSDKDTAIQAAQSYMSAFAAMTIDDAEYYKENANGFLKKAAESYYTYLENDTLGKFKEVTETKATETEKGYSVVCTAEFENVNLVMTLTCNYIGGQLTPTGIAFSTVESHEKTMGEKMSGAALNTLIGLVTVFAILIVISFIISLFRYIPDIQAKFAKKKDEPEKFAAVENVTSQIEAKEELADAIKEKLGGTATVFIGSSGAAIEHEIAFQYGVLGCNGIYNSFSLGPKITVDTMPFGFKNQVIFGSINFRQDHMEEAIQILQNSCYDEIVELIDKDEFTEDPIDAYENKIYAKGAPMKTAVIWNEKYVDRER